MDMQAKDASAGAATLDEKSKKTLADWIGDMVALETHIGEALDRQIGEVKDDPIATTAVRGFQQVAKGQLAAMKTLQEKHGTTPGNPIIKVGAALLGKAAGIVDNLRAEGVSKIMRDDYTAFNLAAIGYTMLHTTAQALGDNQVAEISKRHLTGYAAEIQRINQLMPDIVVAELAKDDHKVAPGAADATRKIVDTAWKTTDQSGK